MNRMNKWRIMFLIRVAQFYLTLALGALLWARQLLPHSPARVDPLRIELNRIITEVRLLK